MFRIRMINLQSVMGVFVAFFALRAEAHPAEQGLVLLLPTGIYTLAGVSAVALTVVLSTMIPSATARLAFLPLQLPRISGHVSLRVGLSLLSFVILTALILAGLYGPSDPLSNPLPLVVWTLFWIVLPILHAMFGNLWVWLNPWSGVQALLVGRREGIMALPLWLGCSPAILLFVLINSFALADPAPDQPARLAMFLAGYWGLTMAGIFLFGETWLKRGEAFGLFFNLLAQLSPIRFGRYAGVGFPGWRILHRPAPPLSLAAFAIVMLACGSFDGLNETFWWLAQIGVNPLEFPGRSAIIGETVTGLVLANAFLFAMILLTCLLGWVWAGRGIAFRPYFARMALTFLPIALGYHIAHFLPAFLVNIQYVLVAISDPLAMGADYLGLGEYYVSTGFFNRTDTVQVIYFTQAGAVVIGHVVAILLSHGTAVQSFEDGPAAFKSQAPMVALMIAYTFLGLWLLATPRGA